MCDPERPERRRGIFATTQWSVVVAAGDSEMEGSRDALASLCRAYWWPVFALVRKQVRDPEAAKDLTQDFFASLLEKKALKVADRERGRFRSFLVATLRNHLANRGRHERAQRRGGGLHITGLEFTEAEGRLRHEPIEEETPDREFDRRWARALLDRTMERLRREMGRAQPDRFRAIEPFLTGRDDGVSYRDVASKLGVSEDVIKTSVRRMRQRYGKLLREEVSQTVVRPEDIDTELRYLLQLL